MAPDGWPVGVELGAGRFASDRDADLIGSVGDGVAPLSSPPALFTPSGETAEDRDAGASAIISAVQWAADRPEDLSLAMRSTDPVPANLAPGDPPAPIDYLSRRTASAGHRLRGCGARRSLVLVRGRDAASRARPTPWPSAVCPAWSTELLGSTVVWLSTAVLSISRTDDAVSLRLGTGESVTFDRVIVTVPLGVLKAQAIEIDPPLPFDQRAAIDAIGFGDVEDDLGALRQRVLVDGRRALVRAGQRLRHRRLGEPDAAHRGARAHRPRRRRGGLPRCRRCGMGSCGGSDDGAGAVRRRA